MAQLTVNDILIRFNVSGFNISRLDTISPFSMTQNIVYAHFEFSEHWSNMTPTIVMTHNYATIHLFLDDENMLLIPNEMLQEVGTIEVSVFAGNIRTINSSFISVVESGFREETPPRPPEDIFTYVKTPNNQVPLLRSQDGSLQWLDSATDTWRTLDELLIDEHTLVFGEQGQLTVNTTDDFVGDNTLPMTALGVEVIVGNIHEVLTLI